MPSRLAHVDRSECGDQDGIFGGDWSQCECPVHSLRWRHQRDSSVGVNDLLAVIAAWNTSDQNADIDDDGIVGVNDLLAVIGSWARAATAEPFYPDSELAPGPNGPGAVF